MERMERRPNTRSIHVTSAPIGRKFFRTCRCNHVHEAVSHETAICSLTEGGEALCWQKAVEIHLNPLANLNFI